MIQIKDKERIKIKDLNIMVARKMYDLYRNDPNTRFDEKKFKRQLFDELKIEYTDFDALMKYMLEKNYIFFRQDSVGSTRYFLVTAKLIDFVENLPNG